MNAREKWLVGVCDELTKEIAKVAELGYDPANVLERVADLARERWVEYGDKYLPAECVVCGRTYERDELRYSRGWRKCAECRRVFDGNE